MSANEKSVQQITVQKSGAATFPIDLAHAKIAQVKHTGDTIKIASMQGGTQQTTATFRTISTGQPSQVRVVMPSATIMPQSIQKLESNATAPGGRAQITAIPNRTLPQTSITVTRPAAQAAYLPRASATNIQTQRLATPIRTPTPPAAGLAGAFVRSTTVPRSTTSPATTVISPTTATWMAASSGNQMQFIRTINPPRQRLVSTSAGGAGVVAIGQTAHLVNNQVQPQQSQSSATIQTTSQPAQQTFVATLSTVLQTRQPTATLVYTNVSGSQAQQYNSTGSQQRYAVTAATIAGGQRQVRPIQLGSRTLASSKIVLAPSGTTVANVQGRTTTGNVNLSTGSLQTTRIIQLQQQQSGSSGQQLLGTSRIPNMMLQPFIMGSGAAKVGIRPQTTLSAKVQPSLTITQLGLGKLSGGQSAITPTLTATTLQGTTINPSSAGNIVSSVPGSNVTQSSQCQQNVQQSAHQQQAQQSTCVSNTQQPITQIVNVNQSSGQIIAQNVNVGSSTTVVPLAISSRVPNILPGSITPNKTTTASAISIPPVAKVIPQQQPSHLPQNQAVHVANQNSTNQANEIVTSSQHHQSTSVFIHTRPSNSGSGGSSTVVPNALIQQAGNFYYESIPASSVTVSTGVLSLTTTTVTSSISTSQGMSSTNLASGLSTSIAFNPTNTYTVVPATNRTIPVSSAGGQTQPISKLHTVPLRFTSQHIQEQALSVSGQQGVISQHQSNQSHQQHSQIITMSQSPHSQVPQTMPQTHMIIPVQTSIKLPTTAVVAASSPRSGNTTANINAITSAFLRKRDTNGSPIRAAKNLAPTLLSMSSAQVSNLITGQSREQDERALSPQSRPGSSSGSTTVSANSSPGIDQQMSEEINSMNSINVRISNESHFSPINDMYPNLPCNIGSSATRQPVPQMPNLHQQSSNNGNRGSLDVTPKKKAKRSIDNPSYTQQQQQLFNHHQSSHQLQNNTVSNQYANSQLGQHQSGVYEEYKVTTNNSCITTKSNKENTKPLEIILKKPRTCNLLDGYKQNWKAANNHFQRYSDVKPREERPPTVMDLANQAHVVQKINGWKIFHLSSQMEDLCEIESQVFDKLSVMLKQLESHGPSPETDRINDLIKGNMQRSKIIVDGVHEARAQIMKIFDHKSHVSDIIQRCASKRNFKKREKI